MKLNTTMFPGLIIDTDEMKYRKVDKKVWKIIKSPFGNVKVFAMTLFKKSLKK